MPMMIQSMAPHHGKIKRAPHKVVKQKKKSKEPTSVEKEVLSMVNELRRKGVTCGKEKMPPVHPLSYNEKLKISARKHAKDMGKKGYFSHDSLDGSGPAERIEDQGYQGMTWGENIAAGQESPRDVMNSWIQSEGHCRNMMYRGFKEIGVGSVYVKGSEYGYYWVQNFGAR
jgi:hypothetical protein